MTEDSVIYSLFAVAVSTLIVMFFLGWRVIGEHGEAVRKLNERHAERRSWRGLGE
jgi:membrane protein required for beta-lactamase induction